MAGALINPTLLGYPDEEILDKHFSQIDFTTSKIGGLPDWIGPDIPISELACTLCQSPCQLICQIYAPLENSIYHRSLYVFACIQPSCWNHPQSWKCFRGQSKDQEEAGLAIKSAEDHFSQSAFEEVNWSDDDGEEDSNLTGQLQNLHLRQTCNSAIAEDPDPNGNISVPLPSSPDGAEAMLLSVDEVSADVEADQIQEVIIDSLPNEDLLANNTAIPQLFALTANNPIKRTGHFKPIFLAVEEEPIKAHHPDCDLSAHERQLLVDYKSNEQTLETMPSSEKKGGVGHKKKSESSSQANNAADGYEKSAPRHGDIGFHKFVSMIKKHPGQVLRYCRDLQGQTPLLLKPKSSRDLPTRCSSCGASAICELQILPTLIPSLKLVNEDDKEISSSLEFGNVLIYTCLKSCWFPDSFSRDSSSDCLRYKREQVFVEAEVPF